METGTGKNSELEIRNILGPKYQNTELNIFIIMLSVHIFFKGISWLEFTDGGVSFALWFLQECSEQEADTVRPLPCAKI